MSDVVGPYDLHIEGDDYVFTWDGGVVEARLSRLSEGKGETTAEIMVSTTMPPSPGVLEWGRINLSAMSTRASLAKQLAARCPGFDWQGALLQVSAKAVKIRREGEPTIDLRDVQPRDTRWMLWPYIEYGGPTVMFADGGTGKSVLALAMGYSVATGKPLLGTPRTQPMGVLYLDWETDSWTHAERLRAIHNEYAFGDDMPTIRYKRMVGSLADSVTQLRAEVSRWGIGLTIVDSLSLASGGPLEESASATTFFDAVRSLNTCILAISHVSKGSMQPDNKGKSNPFGCHSDDTEVLTRAGWRRHGEWTEGEEILCFDPQREVFTWQAPTHLHRYDYTGPMYHVHMASTDALVTPSHRLYVKPAWKYEAVSELGASQMLPRSWFVRTAEELNGSAMYIPHANPLDEVGVDAEHITADRKYAAEPFMRLLGWWISEGCLQDNALGFAQAEGDLARQMRDTLTELGIDYWHQTKHWMAETRPHEKPCCYIRTRKSSALAKWMRTHAGSGASEKRIPDPVWGLSARLKRILFEALVDGDGSRRANGAVQYCTVSKRLADDVQRLAIELGMGANVSGAERAKPHHHDRFYVHIMPGHRRTLCLRGERHLKIEDYSGSVWCFTVPADAYLTRRNGRMFVSGNSIYWRNTARIAWFLESAREEGSDVTKVRFENVKSNNGRIQHQHGYQLAFRNQGPEGEEALLGVSIKKIDLTEEPEFAKKLTWNQRLAATLAHGRMTTGEVAEALEEPDTVKVSRELSKLKAKGKIIRLSDSTWALAAK